KDESWKEFELRFEEVHTDFFKKLNDRFPDLTQNDKRLCAYLRLNISTKDIANLLYLSVAGVESARYRLRKKLNINSTDIDIVQFLENL
ncbi:MAG: helix-turn-helix transcriptional regulator, partial [Bacteroidales bacterium]